MDLLECVMLRAVWERLIRFTLDRRGAYSGALAVYNQGILPSRTLHFCAGDSDKKKEATNMYNFRCNEKNHKIK